jgi:hypothetical protein
MRKLAIGATLLAVLIGLAFFFMSSQQLNPNATPCERDCFNDSGGKTFCADYCQKNGTYGPPKK